MWSARRQAVSDERRGGIGGRSLFHHSLSHPAAGDPLQNIPAESSDAQRRPTTTGARIQWPRVGRFHMMLLCQRQPRVYSVESVHSMSRSGAQVRTEMKVRWQVESLTP